MDMLAGFELTSEPKQSDYLVLNSIAMFEKAKQHFSSYEKVFLYLDNDPSGNDIKKKIIETNLSSFEDMSQRYKDFKDLNDFVISLVEQNRRLNNNHSLRL
jgi:5S rRNA maturation endonuclease (ribonuclease M5)